MNSLQRIFLSLRAAIAEIPAYYYGLSTLVGSFVLIFLSIVNSDEDDAKGTILSELDYWDVTSMQSILVSAGWIAATALSGILLSQQFKEENSSIRSLTLPLKRGEHLGSLLTLHWLVIPIISFVPLLLWATVAWLFTPEWLQLTPPRYLLPVLWIGPLLHLISSAAWLFPMIAFPKKALYIIPTVIIAVLLYTSYTQEMFNDSLSVNYKPEAYADLNVAGINELNILYADTVPEQIVYQIPTANSTFFIFTAFAAIIMLVSAAMALNRKTA
ncbi:MAG: hypothetical protein AAF840_01140 [Bacteroidota bacterium]